MPRKSDTLKKPVPPFPSQHQSGPGQEAALKPLPQYRAPNYRPANKLESKVAIVTGGDSGIGRAVAILFAREGADVAITYLPEEQNDAALVQQEIESLGRRCLPLAGNLVDPAFCTHVIDSTIKEWGRLDIVVSNAAHQNRKKRLTDLEDAEMYETFETNVYAYMRLARAALPHLKPGAALIATSSETGILGSKDLPDYSATKGAINAFTKSLAMNLIDRGIRVNAVAPGPVWTPLNPSDEGLSPDGVGKFGSKSPMGRPAQPEELAPAYVFLASEADSSYITGTVLQVMGGKTSGG